MQFTIASIEGMSNDAPINECESEIDHYTWHVVSYSLRRVCGFFNVPQIFLLHVQGLLRRDLRPTYPRILESLTVCKCYYKGSTFSSVI